MGERWATVKAIVYLLAVLVVVSMIFYGLDLVCAPVRMARLVWRAVRHTIGVFIPAFHWEPGEPDAKQLSDVACNGIAGRTQRSDVCAQVHGRLHVLFEALIPFGRLSDLDKLGVASVGNDGNKGPHGQHDQHVDHKADELEPRSWFGGRGW